MKTKRQITTLLIKTVLPLGLVTCGVAALVVTGFTAGSLINSWALAASIVAVITVFGLASTALTLLAIQKTIAKPIQHLSNAMRTISATNNLSLRVPQTDSDEISPVVDSINQMLETAESYHLDMLKARYEVESANKGKSLFIAKVSHELRTPIHSITGMLRILLKQETASGKRQYIQMAQDSALSLLETINEILDFSKMQNGDLSLERESFNLTEIIRSTVEHLIPRFEEKPELALCWNVTPNVPSIVTGDAARIRNILVNLLGNAFKFTDKGYVTLHVDSCLTEVSGIRSVRFTVADTGIGISSNKLKTIFDPFTTADERSARLYAGTGLGLAIVKQITEKMGGTISVESTPGQGSTFVVDVRFECTTEETATLTPALHASRVAVLASPDMRQQTVADGLRAFGCDVSLFSLDDPEQVTVLTASSASFDIIHVIKGHDILMDELNPLFRAAAQHDVRVVLSVPSSEISSTDILARSETFFVTLQPTSSLDILLICAGKLSPTTSLRESEDISEKAAHKLNILIADDAKTNRIILKTLLEEAGHTVEVVENGRELLERIAFKPDMIDQQSPSFDLVLTDIQMPVMDGITATQNFRELERQAKSSRKLPIVAVTSYAFPEECSKMLASGIDHILTKPINPKRLSRLISQITYDTDSRYATTTEPLSDYDIIAELCQLTENLVDRAGDLRSAIESALPADAVTPIDIQGVFERSGDSLKRTGLILSGFLESYEEQLAIMEASALPLVEPTAFRRTVHSLKGLLLDAGAQVAADLAASLEDKVVREPQTVTPEEIARLSISTREAAEIIQEIVSALPSIEVYSALPGIDEELSLH